MSKKDTIAFYKQQLKTDPRWCIRAVKVLYDLQTPDEQDTAETTHRNGVGFNAYDAPILTSLALVVKSGGHLSQKQIAILHKRLPKYAGQLYSVRKDA